MCNLRIAHHDRQTLSSGDGNIEPVAVQDKINPTSAKLSGALTKRDYDDGCLLSLELIY